MRSSFLVGIALLGGCSYAVIEPGHAGLLFNPRAGGVQNRVLGPNRYNIGFFGRMIDYDITYSKHSEEIHTISQENLPLDLIVGVRYRPIQSELYALNAEIGANYYDEVIGPEFKTTARGVFARHSYLDLQKNNKKIEDEVEAELRERIANKHIEIASVTIEHIGYPADLANTVRARIVNEEAARSKKAKMESDALQENLAIEQEAVRAKKKAEAAMREMQMEAERARLHADQTIKAKENERLIAEEQAKIDKVQAEAEAAVRVVKAKAEAQALSALAKAHAEEKRAEAKTLTALQVMMHGYDALGKLGGDGTTILLGDWSRAPNFLFPHTGAFANPFFNVSPASTASTGSRVSSRRAPADPAVE